MVRRDQHGKGAPPAYFFFDFGTRSSSMWGSASWLWQFLFGMGLACKAWRQTTVASGGQLVVACGAWRDFFFSFFYVPLGRALPFAMSSRCSWSHEGGRE